MAINDISHEAAATTKPKTESTSSSLCAWEFGEVSRRVCGGREIVPKISIEMLFNTQTSMHATVSEIYQKENM